MMNLMIIVRVKQKGLVTRNYQINPTNFLVVKMNLHYSFPWISSDFKKVKNRYLQKGFIQSGVC